MRKIFLNKFVIKQQHLIVLLYTQILLKLCVGFKKLDKKEFGTLSAIMLLLTLVYTLVSARLNGFWIYSSPNDPPEFWSPDSGARFAMICNWMEHGSLIHFYYTYYNLDPTGQIHPLSYFLFHQEHGFTSMYPVVFPLISGVAYREFGKMGLTLLPMVSGLSCVVITYLMARQLKLRSKFLLALAFGLATPLILYSSIFWDHSVIMLVVALAGYGMLKCMKANSFTSALIAGITMALGMWLHELFIALFVAAWLAALPMVGYRRNILLGLPIGFTLTILFWCAFNWRLYGTLSGPHLGANVFQNNPDHPFSLQRIFNSTSFIDRSLNQLIGTTFNNTPSNLWRFYLLFESLLIIYAFWPWMRLARIPLEKLTVVGLIAALTALFLILRTYINAPAAGLFQATPFLIPSVTVPFYVQRISFATPSTGIFFGWLSRTCFLFLLFLLINPMNPGVDWGSRYLLSALPLLALLTAYALERQYEDVQNLKRCWRICYFVSTMGLIVISFICQSCGLSWILRNIIYDRKLDTQVRAISSPVLVTDSDFNARLSVAPASQARFSVRSDDDANLFCAVITTVKIKEFTFVGLGDGVEKIENALSHSRQTFVRSEPRLLFKVNHNREAGAELQIVHYTLNPESDHP